MKSKHAPTRTLDQQNREFRIFHNSANNNVVDHAFILIIRETLGLYLSILNYSVCLICFYLH